MALDDERHLREQISKVISMKRLAALSAALAFASVAGLAHAGSQISPDDFSTLTGSSARPFVTSSSAPVARVGSGYDVQASAEVEQGLTGPQAPRAVSTMTRAQVKEELELARSQGLLEPGYEYLGVAGAPMSHPKGQASSYAGTKATPAGQ
ncbi:MAG: hypothetical protein QM674_10250 [Burkholderiaceae bacterium]